MKILRYWRPDDLPASLPHTEGDHPSKYWIQDNHPGFRAELARVKANPLLRYTLHEQTETLIEERR